MVEHVRDKPTAKGLSCRLLLNYALDDNDVIGLSHVQRSGRC